MKLLLTWNVFTKKIKQLSVVNRIYSCLTKNYNLKYCVFLSLVSIALFSSIRAGILLGGDFSWPLNLDKFLDSTVLTWDESVGFGYPSPRQHASLFPFAIYAAFLQFLGVKNSFIQIIYIYISFLLSLLGFYGLARTLRFDGFQSSAAALLYCTTATALLYLNPVHGFQFPIYFYTPFAIFLAYRFIDTGKVRFLLYLIILPVNSSFSNPVFFGVYLLMIILGSSIFISQFNHGKNVPLKAQIYRLSGLLTTLIVANSFWVIPFLFDMRGAYAAASNANLVQMSDLSVATQDSLDMQYALMGLSEGFWTFTGGHMGGFYYDWHAFALSWVNVFSHGTLFSIAILYGIFYGSQDRIYKKILSSFLIACLIVGGLKSSAFFSLPNSFFLSQDYLARAFRSLFPKVGVIYAFYWALLISFGVPFIKKSFANYFYRISFTLLLILIFVISYPFYSGKVFKSQDLLPGHWVEIPDEYYALENYSKSLVGRPPLLVLPLSSYYSVNLNWRNSSYAGSDFIRNLWNGPAVFGRSGGSDSIKIHDCLETHWEDNNYCQDMLYKLGISHLMIRKDTVDISFGGEFRGHNNFSKHPPLELVMSNDYFDLYKLKNINHVNFYISNAIVDANLRDVIPYMQGSIAQFRPHKWGSYSFSMADSRSNSWEKVQKRGEHGIKSGWLMCGDSPESIKIRGARINPLEELIVKTLFIPNSSLYQCFRAEADNSWLIKQTGGIDLNISATSYKDTYLIYYPQIYFFLGIFISIFGLSSIFLLLMRQKILNFIFQRRK